MKKVKGKGDSIPNGPLRHATGPTDYEGLGRERFWELSQEQRDQSLKAIVDQTNAWVDEPSKRFAQGWLSEHQRVQKNVA